MVIATLSPHPQCLPSRFFFIARTVQLPDVLLVNFIFHLMGRSAIKYPKTNMHECTANTKCATRYSTESTAINKPESSDVEVLLVSEVGSIGDLG